MRNTRLIQLNATYHVAIKSAVSMLAYRCMVAMRVLSPYLFAAIFVVLAPHVRAATMEEVFVRQNIDKGYAILNYTARSPAERAGKLHDFMTGVSAR